MVGNNSIEILAFPTYLSLPHLCLTKYLTSRDLERWRAPVTLPQALLTTVMSITSANQRLYGTQERFRPLYKLAKDNSQTQLNCIAKCGIAIKKCDCFYISCISISDAGIYT